MKVLTVHNRYRLPGGEDIVAERETALLLAQGHEIVEYRRTNEEIDSLGTLAKAGLPFRLTWAADAHDDLRQIIRREHPDIAHIHNTFMMISPSAYAACAAEGVPVVQSLHNSRLMCPSANLHRNGAICRDCVDKPFAWPGVLHGCWRGSRSATAMIATSTAVHRFAGTWHQKVDAYIVFSEFFRDEFILAGLPADKIHVKPHFVDPDPGVRFGLGEDYALFAGRLESVKGIMTLLEAWHAVEGLRLKICGDGELTDQVGKAIETTLKGKVEHIGNQSREVLMHHMKGARFLVWPSEGWVWWSGIGVGLSGLTLSVACLLDRVGGMFWSNVFLVPLILVWLAGVGLARSVTRPS